ncbi:MAG: hypothetical protein ACI9HE_003975, partial [Planctomycetota bacterium]
HVGGAEPAPERLVQTKGSVVSGSALEEDLQVREHRTGGRVRR